MAHGSSRESRFSYTVYVSKRDRLLPGRPGAGKVAAASRGPCLLGDELEEDLSLLMALCAAAQVGLHRGIGVARVSQASLDELVQSLEAPVAGQVRTGIGDEP